MKKNGITPIVYFLKNLEVRLLDDSLCESTYLKRHRILNNNKKAA